MTRAGVFLAILLTFFAVSCTQQPRTAKVSGEVTVRVPWPDNNGELHLQNVTLSGIDNLAEMHGDYARFVYSPKTSPDGLQGESPHARFLQTKDDVYVPLDQTSQQLAILYAHLQKLAELDRQSGSYDLLSWPRVVGISVNMASPNGKPWRNNSFYDGDTDAILVVPNDNDQLPLSANPGVLAHEHFHSIFHRLVIVPMTKENLINRTLSGSGEVEDLHQAQRTVFIKSVNEGLADVWGWIYSGDPDFVGSSLPDFKSARSLRVSSGVLTNSWSFLSEVTTRLGWIKEQREQGLTEYAYIPGNSLSRTLRQIFLGDYRDRSVEGLSVRNRLAKRILKALPALTTSFQDQKSSDDLKMDFKGVLRLLTKAETLTPEEKSAASPWLGSEDKK